MAGIFLKWKIQGWEKKLLSASRTSFYKEEAVSLGPISRVTKAYNAGSWAEAIEECYKILIRFDDYSNAEYYLGMSLVKVKEIDLGIEHLKRAITTQRKAMDSFDEHYIEDLIQVCHATNRMPEAARFFEGLAERDAKGKKLLERLRFMKKL